MYLLNSPLLTNYGEYLFEGPLSVEQARALIKPGFVSAVGHEGTAEFLTSLLNAPVACSRERVFLNVGDRALVLTLGNRLDEGAVLDADQLAQQPFELGLVTRLK